MVLLRIGAETSMLSTGRLLTASMIRISPEPTIGGLAKVRRNDVSGQTFLAPVEGNSAVVTRFFGCPERYSFASAGPASAAPGNKARQRTSLTTRITKIPKPR